MDKEQILKSIETLDKLIEEHVTSERKEVVTNIVETLGSRFFINSASSKLEYHSCEQGGLLGHTLRVVDTMYKMNEPIYNCDAESILIAGLFHDLGKIGSVTDVTTGDGIPFYIDEQNDWHRQKLGQLYKKNPELQDYLTHSLRSLRILTQFNLTLKDEEFVAILAHDSYWEEQNRSIDVMRCGYPLLKLIQAADQMATINEKEIEKNK
jgi:23S rRNA maturation-related 3'-5' exoribonuclease YhaM